MIEIVNSARLENLRLVKKGTAVENSDSVEHEWHKIIAVRYIVKSEWHIIKQRPWYLAWLNFFFARDVQKFGGLTDWRCISLNAALYTITRGLNNFTADVVTHLLNDVGVLRKNVTLLGETSLTQKCWNAARQVLRFKPSESENVVFLADADKKLATLEEGLRQRQEQLANAQKRV